MIQKHIYIFLILFTALALPQFARADIKTLEVDSNYLNNVIEDKVREPFSYSGLASFYNGVTAYIVNESGVERLDDENFYPLTPSQSLAIVGHYKVLVVSNLNAAVSFANEKLSLKEGGNRQEVQAQLLLKSDLIQLTQPFQKLKYAYLWGPLAWLAKIVESSLVLIQSHVVSNWGIALVIFSLLLKLLLLPVGVMTVRLQRRVSQIQAQLAPKLAEIKANYDGEEAHNRLMAVHKELGVSPFYTLKPMLGSFIQIPILIAVFNALGEMPQFIDQSFLWIDDLAYPDVIGQLPFVIPMFGDTISLLPFIMTVVTLYSTIIFQNRHAHEVEIKRQKRNLYFMAAAFFVLFYPFPAVMVLYWTLANILQTIQQQFIKS